MTGTLKLAISGLDAAMGEDLEKVENGAWVRIPSLATARVLLRSLGSMAARTKFQKILANHRGDFDRNGVLPPAMIDADQTEMLATVLVAGWEGFLDDKGKPVPCNPDTVRAVMLAYPAVRRFLYQQSDASNVYAKEQVDAIAGNSAPPSVAS